MKVVGTRNNNISIFLLNTFVHSNWYSLLSVSYPVQRHSLRGGIIICTVPPTDDFCARTMWLHSMRAPESNVCKSCRLSHYSLAVK